MINDLIHNDISRCNNHRCDKRANCKRYLQIEIDKSKKRTAWVTRYESENCKNQIL